jgi:hypothetical protein
MLLKRFGEVDEVTRYLGNRHSKHYRSIVGYYAARLRLLLVCRWHLCEPVEEAHGAGAAVFPFGWAVLP